MVRKSYFRFTNSQSIFRSWLRTKWDVRGNQTKYKIFVVHTRPTLLNSTLLFVFKSPNTERIRCTSDPQPTPGTRYTESKYTGSIVLEMDDKNTTGCVIEGLCIPLTRELYPDQVWFYETFTFNVCRRVLLSHVFFRVTIKYITNV